EIAAGGPLRLKDRLGRSAGHALTTPDRAVASERAHPQLRPVPRHVRVVPAEPGQPRSVWAEARGGVEVTAGREHSPRLPAAQVHRRQGVDRFPSWLGMILPHAHDPAAPAVNNDISVPETGLWGQPFRRAARPLAVELP